MLTCSRRGFHLRSHEQSADAHSTWLGTGAQYTEYRGVPIARMRLWQCPFRGQREAPREEVSALLMVRIRFFRKIFVLVGPSTLLRTGVIAIEQVR